MKLILPSTIEFNPNYVLYVSGPQIAPISGNQPVENLGSKVVLMGEHRLGHIEVQFSVFAMGENTIYTVLETGLKQIGNNHFMPIMPAAVKIADADVKTVKFDLSALVANFINAERKPSRLSIRQPEPSVEIGWFSQYPMAPSRVYTCEVVTRINVSVFPSVTELGVDD